MSHTIDTNPSNPNMSSKRSRSESTRSSSTDRKEHKRPRTEGESTLAIATTESSADHKSSADYLLLILDCVAAAIGDVCKAFSRATTGHEAVGRINEELSRQCQQVDEYRVPSTHFPADVLTALVGPMGAGKSSLIYCLLGLLGAANVSDSGTRGTNVVHRYRKPEYGQTELFRIEVHYFTDTAIECRIAQCCKVIYEYLAAEEQDDDGDDEEAGAECDEMLDLGTQHDSAIEYFRTMLCASEVGSFRSAKIAAAYFEQQYRDRVSKEELTSALMLQVKAFRSSRYIVDNIENRVAPDIATFVSIADEVSRPSADSSSPHPWPIVKRVDIHSTFCMAYDLSDTPGITDSDPAIVDRATKELRSAGFVLVIAPLLRCETNSELNGILRQIIRRQQEHTTYLVLTKVDGLLKPFDRTKLSAHMRAALIAAESNHANLEKEKQDWEQHKERLISLPGNDPKNVEANLHLEVLEKSIAVAKARVRDIGIENRNEATQKIMKEKFRELSRSELAPDLKVFFVSCSEYQMHLSPDETPRLSLEATGVPALQDFLRRVPLNGRFGVLKQIALTTLPVILNDVIGALCKTPLEMAMKEGVRELIRSTLENCAECFDQCAQQIKLLFRECLSKPIEANRARWIKKARRLLRSWEGYNVLKYHTFCRKTGYWEPPMKSSEKKEKDEEEADATPAKKSKKENEQETRISWTQTLHEIVAEKFAEDFDALTGKVEQVRTNLDQAIRDHFGKLDRDLEACTAYAAVSATPEGHALYAMLHHSRDELVRSTKRTMNLFRRKLTTLRSDIVVCTESSAETSMFGRFLQDAYTAAAEVDSKDFKGKRPCPGERSHAHQARCQIMQAVVLGTKSKNSIFDVLSAEMQNRFAIIFDCNEDCQGTKDRLTSGMDSTRLSMLDNFDRRYAGHGEKEAQDSGAVKLLRDAAHTALKALEGSVKPLLEECEKAGLSADAADD